MRIYNQLAAKEFRKALRKNSTPQERKIWDLVRNRKILNLKFFRQYGVGKFTVDFYCPEIKLVIEIDGGQHNTADGAEYDDERTLYLNSLKIKVVRFWNNDIDSNLEGVYQTINQTARELMKFL